VQYYGEGNAGGRELDELVDVLQRSIAAIEAKEVNRGCKSPLGLIEPSSLRAGEAVKARPQPKNVGGM
jgi:hypothetical protein